MTRNEALGRYAASRNALSRPSATPWYATVQGMALIASLKRKPRIDKRGIAYEYVGRKVAEIDRYAYDYSIANKQYIAHLGPSVLGAIWGSPQGVTGCHWERSEDIRALRVHLAALARQHGYPRLELRLLRAIERIDGRIPY